jgi:hypothetical protein
MLHVSFSPNLSAVAWHVLRNDFHDLRLKKMQTGLSFFRLTLLGMGLQKPKIKMNTKWLSLAAIVPA